MIVLLIGAAVIANYLSFRFGNRVRLALVLVSPFIYLVVGLILEQFSFLGYDTSCRYECLGNIGVPLVMGAAWVGTEVGALTGWLASRTRS